MGSDAKVLRGQLRQIAKELLPELLSSELGEKLNKDLSKQIQARLEVLVKDITHTLQEIDQRSKDVQGYILRQSASPSPLEPAKEEKIK